MTLSIEFFPFFSRDILLAGGVASLIAIILFAWRSPRGVLLRALCLACLLLALANPSLKNEDRQPLTNVAVLAVDESSSMTIAGRAERAREIESNLRTELSKIPNLEVRTVRSRSPNQPGGETSPLFASINEATADVPSNRIAGVMAITDGQVHDAPQSGSAVAALADAPFHALIAGTPGEKDNRIEIVSAPRFGIVGSQQFVELRAERSEGTGGIASVEIRRGTGPAELIRTPFGQTFRVSMRFERAGLNVLEVDLKPEPGELTLLNNKVVVQSQGIRQNLRVLLVSGEPHAGERTWRNLLRSDAAVDLVHFTILRPPEKHDGTPIDQLSLIAFPTRELFSEKLNQFDLIIFDRYQRRGVLPMIYLDNVARYVEQGGAILVAAGADYASPSSLARTPLGAVLPARPTGRVVEVGFKPAITKAGERHPVTASLPGAGRSPEQEPKWGRWFRVVDSQIDAGEVVLSGAENKPLLILDRKGKGRVALLLSDHAWLWARGYEGGGPYIDLLRRTAHWLMKEPDLEEESLNASASRNQITIERRTIKDHTSEATLTSPSGQTTKFTLDAAGAGLFTKTMAVEEQGVYRVSMDGLRALAVAGETNSPEFRKVVATTQPLQPVLEATGGGAFFLGGTAGAPKVEGPSVSMMRSGTRYYGSTWAGLKLRDSYQVKSVTYTPLVAGFVALAIALGLLSLTWYRESR